MRGAVIHSKDGLMQYLRDGGEVVSSPWLPLGCSNKPRPSLTDQGWWIVYCPGLSLPGSLDGGQVLQWASFVG